MHLYSVLWLFFAYSFLGWVLETVMAALNRRQFVNRGVLTGPVCVRYGIFLVFINFKIFICIFSSYFSMLKGMFL